MTSANCGKSNALVKAARLALTAKNMGKPRKQKLQWMVHDDMRRIVYVECAQWKDGCNSKFSPAN